MLDYFLTILAIGFVAGVVAVVWETVVNLVAALWQARKG